MTLETFTLLSTCLLLGGSLWILQDFGRRMGRRWKKDQDEAGVSAVDGSILALLGLLIAFQMSRAGNRLDARRDVILQEANAIGTAYLRLDMLPRDAAQDLQTHFRKYADSRIRFQKAMPDVEAALAADADSTGLQGEIWTKAIAAGRDAGPQATMLVVPALNQMFDLATTNRIFAQTHAPLAMVSFIFFVALTSAFVSGYGMSANSTRPTLHMLMFALVTSLAVYIILDLEFPRLGLVRIGVADQALMEVRQSMK